MKKCDIIIPVWNELESTVECITKLKENTRYPYRLIVIDNGSKTPTKEYLEGLGGTFRDFILVRNNTNLGFVKAINQGIVTSTNPYICILNNDAYVTRGWLTSLIETVEAGPGNIGVANPTSNVFGKRRADGDITEWQELDSSRGFCMLIKKEVIDKIGLFDEVYGMGYFEEKDFSRRAIEAGFICIRAKASFVYHRDKLSFDKIKERNEIFSRNEKIYNHKWGRPLSVAMISKNKDLRNRKDLIYELLRRGHRVNIFFTKNQRMDNIKDHIEIRYFPINRLFAEFGILFKLFERRRKKKIEVIVTEDENNLKFFEKLYFVHKADVTTGDSDEILSFCNKRSRGDKL